jgi:hypothetical protein
MKAHRIRKAKSLYNKERQHIFLEVEKSRWLEIESLDGVTFDSIQKFVECENKTGIKIVGFTDKHFQYGTIKDWGHSVIIIYLNKKNDI